MKRAWRIGSVFVPPVAAGAIVLRGGAAIQLDVIGILVLAWWVMTGTLVIRYLEATNARGLEQPNPLAHLDVLTSTGRAIMWSGLVAIVLATQTGWASLSVVGILGIGAVCVAVTWTSIVAGGDRPWRAAVITREILPRSSTEGDALREQIELVGVRIPSGMRLFVQGRATPHGLTTRYCVAARRAAPSSGSRASSASRHAASTSRRRSRCGWAT